MQNKIEEAKFFNNFGDDYDVLTEKAYSRILDSFSRVTHPTEGDRIIDLGCGSGAFTARLAKRYPNVNIVGVDISSVLIDKAKKANPNIKYAVLDIEHLPYPAETFDIAVFSGVLHHFIDMSPVLKEAYRVLKKDGRCFAYDPNNDNPFMWLYRNRKSPFFSSKGITSNERLLSRKDLRVAFMKAGFASDVFAIGGITYRYVNGPSALLPVYNFFEELSIVNPLIRRIGSFLISVARKNIKNKVDTI
ncbi:MAG: class I SAM-dependent methyltransferase [Candidatus Omnitrophica bacterium]|nr:class I SAM-dependent methyltransferase [Candidatus Omnitrophota bacterium]